MMQYGDIPLLHLKGTYRVEVHLQMGMERNFLSCLASRAISCMSGKHGKRRRTDTIYYEDWQRNDIADVTKWKPSIHMPKEAARIWLKVTNVRVERLREISAESALAEGADKYIHTNGGLDENMTITSFIGIWNSTIKKADLDRYGWDANPYVWTIEFERCEKPEEV